MHNPEESKMKEAYFRGAEQAQRGQLATASERPSNEIVTGLQMADVNICKLNAMLEVLIDRLQPVRIQRPSTDGVNGVGSTDPVRSPFGEQLDIINYRLANMQARLGQLLGEIVL